MQIGFCLPRWALRTKCQFFNNNDIPVELEITIMGERNDWFYEPLKKMKILRTYF